MIVRPHDVPVGRIPASTFQEKTMASTASNVWSDRALGALRIVSGYLFIAHGTAKLFGAPHIAMFDGLQLFSLVGVAGILEVVGGVAIIAGLFTRPVAFILSGLNAFAYFIAHAPQGNALLPILNGG